MGGTQVCLLIFIASYHLCSLFYLEFGYLDLLVCVKLGCVISLRLCASYRSYPYMSYFASYFIVYSYILAWCVKVRGSSAILGEISLAFYANHVLNIVLSSNTKKGEIERTFPSLLCFDVC